MNAMKNTCMTKQDADRLRFEEYVRFPSNAQEVTIYYLYLINTALELSIISKEDCNRIASNLLSSIFIDVDENSIAGVNLQYIISSYLMNFNKYEALQKVLNYNTEKGLIFEAKVWFEKTIKKLKRLLNGVYKASITAENITLTYNELINTVKQMETSLKENTNFSFKKESDKNSFVYEFLWESYEGKNYIENLKNSVKAFSIEVGIIRKLNGNDLLNQMKKEFYQFSEKYETDEKEKLEIELSKLEERFERKVKEGEKLEEQVDNLLEEFEETFEKEHPEIDEFDPVYANACDEYITSQLGSYEPFDIVKLKKEYKNKRLKLVQKIQEIEERTDDNKEFEKIAVQGELIEDWLTAKMLLKEYYVFQKCSSGSWKYPTNVEERALLYNKVKLQEATEEFVKNFKFLLNPREIIYLKSGKIFG